jgi:beta-galactosidase
MQGIDVYAPWGCHEPEPNRFDFGEGDPALNLPRFLELVAERGMWVLLRPGPQVNAELNNFGLPDRIVQDETIQALGPRGRPVFCPSPPVFFPVPSYASKKYQEEVLSWFEALAEALRPLVGRANPIRLIQVDNETSLFFREAPFDQDYHPDALALWQGWLEEQGLTTIPPPLRLQADESGLRTAMAWVRFRQWMMLGCLSRFRDMLTQVGLDVAPFSHNTPPSGLWLPLRPQQLREVVDVVGTDVYVTAHRFTNARDQVLQIRGIDDEPFAAEMSCGTVYFAPSIGSFDNRFVPTASLAYGLKGFNLYMGAGRDRWIGGLIPEGGEREGADLLHFFQRLIRLMGTIGLRDLKPVAGAAIIVPDAYLHHSLATFPLPGASPALLTGLGLTVHEMLLDDRFGMERAVQIEWLERLRDCQATLSEHSIPYFMTSGISSVDQALLLLAPSYRYLPTQVTKTILEHVDAGGTAIAGPEDPRLDENLQPLAREISERWQIARRTGRLLVVDSLAEVESKQILQERSRRLAQERPYGTSIRAPRTEILPHTSTREGIEFCWIVATGTGPASRIVLTPKRGWRWIRRLSVRQKSTAGEFIQEKGSPGDALTLSTTGHEVHLVEWRRDDVE